MTINQRIINLYHTFSIMGFTHDEISIIIKKSFEAGASV